MEIVNNNATSDVNKSEMSVNKSEMSMSVNNVIINAPSTSEILSTLSTMMSSCRVTIKLLDAKELSQCLPHFQNMLSEMNEMVAFTQHHQQQNPEEWNEILSSKDVSSTMFSSSSLSSDVSLEDSSESSVGDLFVSRMSGIIDYIAPNNVFNKRRSKKMKKRRLLQRVPKFLRAIWQNCEEIFCQAPGPVQQEVKSPIIDWTKVNVRALANIPTPQACPIHSCSQDPEFYESSKWRLSNPFGWKYGYKTQLGTVLVNSEPVHGYIWDVKLEQWILHASYRTEEREKAKSGSRVQVFNKRKIKGKQHTHQKKRING